MNLARFARTTSLLALAALGGCSEQIHFSDSIDLELDLFRQHDELHSPYVVGASFRLCADARNEGALSGGALRSSDASILELGATEEDDEGRRGLHDRRPPRRRVGALAARGGRGLPSPSPGRLA